MGAVKVNAGVAMAIMLSACAAQPRGPDLTVAWDKNMLSIRGPEVPGGEVKVWYLEAYCRSGSTDRDWKQTVIPHRTEKLEEAPDGKFLKLRCRVEGGVEVVHEIRAGPGEVDFRLTATNAGAAPVDAVWVQPCIRVDAFTGLNQDDYIRRSFIFIDGRQAWLDRIPRAEEALFRGGQVYVPAGIDRRDVNPRPISSLTPSHGLIGCVSADETKLLATAWEPYQELFQGVIVCLHSDFRLGGLRPGETKRARGKIYIIENDSARLLQRYRRDFGSR
jgi:hypothetical protein